MRKNNFFILRNDHVHFNCGDARVKGNQESRNSILGAQTPGAAMALDIKPGYVLSLHARDDEYKQQTKKSHDERYSKNVPEQQVTAARGASFITS
jgi:hypothetical protein